MAEDKSMAEKHAGDPQNENQQDLSGAGDPGVNPAAPTGASNVMATGNSDPALTTTGGVKKANPSVAPVTAPGPGTADKASGDTVIISREIIDGLYGRMVTFAQAFAQNRPEPSQMAGMATTLHTIADDLLSAANGGAN